MKAKMFNCWLFLFVCMVSFAFGSANAAKGQSSYINFNGPAGNVLTTFLDVYPNYPNSDATFNAIVQTTNQPLPVGTYLGWCVDADTEIDPTANNTVAGLVYTGELFPSCDTNLNNELPPGHTPTSYVSPAVWNEVNYLLNHKNGTNFWAVQVAINDLVGGPTPPSPPYPAYNPADVSALLTAVTNNAATWFPQPGDVIGAVYVISQQGSLVLTNPVQFLMVEVPYCPVTFTKCPPNISLGCNPSSIPDINIDPTNVSAVSSCDYPLTITGVKSEAKVGCSFYRYLNYTAADAYGNSASCAQSITWTVDTNAPVLISAPTNANLGYNPVNLPTDASVQAQVNYAETCSALTVNVSHVDSGYPCALTRTFSIYALDACGNISATNYVTYNWAVDTNAPVITSVPPSTNFGCSYFTLPTDASVAGQITAMDNCTLASTNVTHIDTTNGVIATRTFSITVKDAAGNVSATNNIVYTWSINTGISIACAADITINGTNDLPSITGIPSLFDACGNPITCTNSATTLTTNYLNLYYDQFSGPACGLNGRAPDSADMGGFKWAASANWTSTGSQAATTNCNANAFLPFQPTPGYLYQVSADVECVASPTTTPASDWVALGFANGSTVNGYWFSINNPVGWQLVRNSGNTTYSGQTFQGTGISGGSNDGYYPTNIIHYSVLLDTRPSSPAAWTFTYYANGKVVTPATAFGGSGPAISTVGFGLYSTGGAAAHVKNFTVALLLTSLTTNSGTCANLSYADSVVPGTCAGKVHIARTWSAWDNQGHTNTCAQNIYENITLPPVGFATSSTNLGCAPSTLPTDTSVAALVTAYSGLSSTNVSHLDVTNMCNVTRTFTVTVGDACGNVSTAANLVYSWVNATPAVSCWVKGPTNGTCLSPCTYTCWVTNTGNAPFSSCLVTACGQTFTCPALNPGQSCSFPINYTFQAKDLGLFNCSATATAVCATSCSPACNGYGNCLTTVCGSPACKVICSGPNNGLCNSSATYYCCVTNTGTCPFTSCLLNACGQSFTCPALQPGQGCVIPVSHSFQLCDLGLFNCLASVNATCTNSTTPTCSGQATCPTTVVGQPSCKVICSGPSSGLCLSPATYYCAVTNNGTCPFSACTVSACGQNFSCPALQPGQGCVITVPHTFQVCDLGNFNCAASVNANCINSTIPTCSTAAACTTSVVGQPSCKVTCCGPAKACFLSPATYTCCVTNTGTAPFSACTLTACGKSFTCPALQPGQGCSIPVTCTFSLVNLGAFKCQAAALANCINSTAPTCSDSATCTTTVSGAL